jgi:hypothetical protein
MFFGISESSRVHLFDLVIVLFILLLQTNLMVVTRHCFFTPNGVMTDPAVQQPSLSDSGRFISHPPRQGIGNKQTNKQTRTLAIFVTVDYPSVLDSIIRLMIQKITCRTSSRDERIAVTFYLRPLSSQYSQFAPRMLSLGFHDDLFKTKRFSSSVRISAGN